MAVIRIDLDCRVKGNNPHDSVYINSDKVVSMIASEHSCTFALVDGSKLKVSPWLGAFEKFMGNDETDVVEVEKLEWLSEV